MSNRDRLGQAATVLSAGSCFSLVLVAYARMTGVDPLFQFVWRSRIGAGVLFVLIAGFLIVTTALLLRRTPFNAGGFLRVILGSVVLVLLAAVAARGFGDSGEFLRVVIAPWIAAALPGVGVVNLLVAYRIASPGPSRGEPKQAVLYAGSSAGVAIAFYFATNVLVIEGVVVQMLTLLAIAVIPSLCLCVATLELASDRRLASMPGLALLLGTSAAVLLLGLL